MLALFVLGMVLDLLSFLWPYMVYGAKMLLGCVLCIMKPSALRTPPGLRAAVCASETLPGPEASSMSMDIAFIRARGRYQ